MTTQRFIFSATAAAFSVTGAWAMLAFILWDPWWFFYLEGWDPFERVLMFGLMMGSAGAGFAIGLLSERRR